MSSRWFNLVVVLLWIATMSWLVTTKVLPPLLLGEPPSYETILAAREDERPVGWRLSWNGRPVGWAISEMERINGLAEIHSRVHFEELPLEEMTPAWLQAFFRIVDGPPPNTPMDTVSMVSIDPLGRLVQLESSVHLGAVKDVIVVSGSMEEGQLRLVVRSGEFSYETEIPIQSHALLSDSLSPQTKLPGLHLGQTWKVRTYSPLRAPNSPVELLEATVETMEPIVWGGEQLDVWLVVYRSAPGSGLSNARSPRGRLWVRRDGTVLKQEVHFFNSAMAFVRLSDRAAQRLLGQEELRPERRRPALAVDEDER